MKATASLSTAELGSLQQLLTLPRETALAVLDALKRTVEEVVPTVEELMRKERGWADGVVDLLWGFHAVPSMKCVPSTWHRSPSTL